MGISKVSKLEAARRESGVSRELLAARTGYSVHTLARIEQGKMEPWPQFRRKMAEVLGVPEKELFEVAA